MSCSEGSGSCGCGGDKSKPDSAETPVDRYIKSGSAPVKPAPAQAHAIQRFGNWFKNQVIADMRITRVRVLSQTFFFLLFLFFVIVTDLRYLKGYPVSLFLEINPLVGFATAITTTTVYKGLILCTLLLIPTFVLGRFFCNWICPYGTLHQLTGWLFGRRDDQARIESNRFQKLQQLKYVFLIMMIVAACFGSLQIGLLDPICLFHRSMSTAVLPALNEIFPDTVYVKQYYHVGAWAIGLMLLFFGFFTDFGQESPEVYFLCRISGLNSRRQ